MGSPMGLCVLCVLCVTLMINILLLNLEYGFVRSYYVANRTSEG